MTEQSDPTQTRYCQYCQCDHPLTLEFWMPQRGKLSCCRIRKADTRHKWDQKNAEKISAQKKIYNQLPHTKAGKAAYRERNLERTSQWHKNHRLLHKDELNARSRALYPKRREYKRNYERNKLQTDMQYRLAKNLRSRMKAAIKNQYKTGSAIKDLGCSLSEFKQYLESKFKPGMTWDNWRMDGWHIDHITPLSSFDLTDREQWLIACNFKNMQPLWASENLSKNDKIPEEI